MYVRDDPDNSMRLTAEILPSLNEADVPPFILSVTVAAVILIILALIASERS